MPPTIKIQAESSRERHRQWNKRVAVVVFSFTVLIYVGSSLYVSNGNQTSGEQTQAASRGQRAQPKTFKKPADKTVGKYAESERQAAGKTIQKPERGQAEVSAPSQGLIVGTPLALGILLVFWRQRRSRILERRIARSGVQPTDKLALDRLHESLLVAIRHVQRGSHVY